MGYLKIEKNNSTYSNSLITDTSMKNLHLLNLNQQPNLLKAAASPIGRGPSESHNELFAYFTQPYNQDIYTHYPNFYSSLKLYPYTSSFHTYTISGSESQNSSFSSAINTSGTNDNYFWANGHAFISPRSISNLFQSYKDLYGVNYTYPDFYLKFGYNTANYHLHTTFEFNGGGGALYWWNTTMTRYHSTRDHSFAYFYSLTDEDLNCPLYTSTSNRYYNYYETTNNEFGTLRGYEHTAIRDFLIATASFFDGTVRIDNTITTWKNSKSRQSVYQANTTAWSTFAADHSTPIELTLTTKSTTFSNTLVDKLADAASEQGLVFDWLGGIFKGSETLQTGTKKITATNNRYLYWSVYKSLADWIIQKDTRYTTFPGLPTEDEDWWANHWAEHDTWGGHITTLKTYVTNHFGKTSNSYTHSTEVSANANPSYYNYIYNDTYSFSISMKNHLQVTCSGTSNSLASISHKEYVRMLQSYTIKTALTQSIDKILENGQTFVNVTGIRTIRPRISISLSQKVQESIWSKVRSTGSISGSLSYAGTASFPEVKSKYTTTTNTTRSSGYTLTEKSAGGTTLSSGTVIDGTTYSDLPASIPRSTTVSFVTAETKTTRTFLAETHWTFLTKELNIKKNNETLNIFPMSKIHNNEYSTRGTSKLFIRCKQGDDKNYCLKYPLTTHTTASQYSPIALKVNNTLAYLATTSITTSQSITTTTALYNIDHLPLSVFDSNNYYTAISSSLVNSSCKTYLTDYVKNAEATTSSTPEAAYPYDYFLESFVYPHNYATATGSRYSKWKENVYKLIQQSVGITYVSEPEDMEVTNTLIISHYYSPAATLKKNTSWTPFLNASGIQSKAFHNGTVFISGMIGGGSVYYLSYSKYNGTVFQNSYTRCQGFPAAIMTFIPEKTLTIAYTYETITSNINI